MRFLVTGGAGFIGSHIAEALTEQGHFVRILDNFSTGKRENLAHITKNLEIIQGDITDPACVNTAVKDMNGIFHEAAAVSVTLSMEDPLGTHEINVTGTLNVFEAARKNGVKRVVYATSAAVYGNGGREPRTEKTPPSPASNYGLHKLINEKYARLYSQAHNLDTVGLRYFNVWGPRQDPFSPYSGVLSIFLDCFAQKTIPTIFGDGEQTRDFIFVKDIVAANLLAWETPGIAGQVFNVGTGSSVSLNTVIDIFNKAFGFSIKPKYGPERPGDIRHSLADISKIRNTLGFKPQWTFQKALTALV